MNVHFIAIGGAAMHNLAIALHLKGYNVTGSDDEIFDPAKSRLQKYGLLPESFGWHPERITSDIDAVVLGMHARADNPELLKAQELGLRIYSYPEYLYEQSKDKTRVVIGGSHGKTTTTAMILHVLAHAGIEADYMVGAQLEGFEVMVRLSETAKVMVIEGDEYLTSPIDRRPKFHVYKPNIAVITGIEWDHINVFPTFDIYKDQFAQFINLIQPISADRQGTLVYCADDAVVREVAEANNRAEIVKMPYDVPKYEVVDGITYLIADDGRRTPLRVFGRHNLLNLTAARYVCRSLGVNYELFDEAISTFGGASKRLELVKKSDRCAVYKDFAHAPSKLRATIHAMREQYPDRKLVACMELHTFSSLTQEFLKQYHGTMTEADVRYVYFSQHALQLKKLPPLDPADVQAAFGDGVQVFTDSKVMVAELKKMPWSDANLLMMSSGNFDGIDFAKLADELI
ncbi:MAG: peptidoglycan synthetase [Bacteroidales bacterium]|nr:peptidoglycan synthetase [Bacteroidales bacterium]